MPILKMLSRFIPAVLGLVSTLLAAEPFRPAFHFTPERNWINDPNGMLFYQGEYHLFYQYNPFGDKWGHMSWGHAVSRDLMRWEHLPLALPEKDGIMIFSGSAVVDWNNTSGFGKGAEPPFVAIYTGHREGRQDQRIAFSNDRGRTWTQFEGNPVLDIGKADFRDPKVIWHEASKRWVMAVTLPTEKKISFYGSPDLKQWGHLSDFGPAGALNGIWECPDLFELPVENDPGRKKWVLLLNINPGAPAGGSGCQYFVGDFDGSSFTLDAGHPSSEVDLTGAIRTLTDFEGSDFGGWQKSGTAFDSGPSQPAPGKISGFQGKAIANSFGSGDEAIGKLVSPALSIDGDWLAFRIGGGRHPGKTGIRLMIDGKVVHDETGNHSSHMEWKSWDLRELRGKDAVIEIFDEESGNDWGHITVDQIVLGKGPRPMPGEAALWADYGPDYYATVTWSDIPKSDGRRIAIGWMSNWEYAEAIPTAPWRGAMTLPRVMTLRQTRDGLRLVQHPVKEAAGLASGKPLRFAGGSMEEAVSWLGKQSPLPATLDISMKFTDMRSDSAFTIVLADEAGGETLVGFADERLFVDRTKSGLTDFHPKFAARYEGPVIVEDDKFTLRMLLDHSSLEVFAADGALSMTHLLFPKPGARRISIREVRSVGGIANITIQPLKGSPQ
jgi:fructan beta-fructosidase